MLVLILFKKIFEIVTGLRKLKSDNKIKQIDVVEVMVNQKSEFDFNKYSDLIEKLSKTKNLEVVNEIPGNYPTLISDKDTLCLAIEKSDDSKEDTMKQIKYLIYFVKKNNFEKNIIFVTHYVLISEVLDYASSSGEIIVSDKDFNMIGTIKINY